MSYLPTFHFSKSFEILGVSNIFHLSSKVKIMFNVFFEILKTVHFCLHELTE